MIILEYIALISWFLVMALSVAGYVTLKTNDPVQHDHTTIITQPEDLH